MISNLFLFAALIEVAISGRDVPIAMIDKPKNESEIFNMFEIFIAELTVICAPSKVIIIEKKIIGNAKFQRIFLKDNVENKSLSISTLFFITRGVFKTF